MKKISFCLNFLSIALVVVTPHSFHNDYIIFCDAVIAVTIILNLFLLRIIKYYFIKKYLIISILQFLYCILTISSNSELEYKRARISDIFSKPDTFSLNILSVLENVSIIFFLLFVIFEVWFLYISITKNQKKVSQKF